MRKICAATLAVVIGMGMLIPSTGYSSPWMRDRGPGRVVVNRYNWGPPHPTRTVYVERHHDDGLAVAGAALGGIVLGTILGTAISQPRPINPRPAVYGTVSPGSTAYAYPGPDHRTMPSYTDNPPGMWTHVPGQWINGKWVPEHRVWVPVNP
jgi:hypothetical protein